MNLLSKRNLNLFYVIINVSIFFIFISTNQISKFDSNLPFLIIFLFILNLIAILLPSSTLKINYFFILVFSYIFLLISEIYYEKIFFKFCNSAECKIKVINNIKKNQKLDVKFNLLPKHFINDQKIIPLSSFTETLIIGSNENGYFPVHKSDKYGFFNKKNFYDDKIDLLIIGDSYAQGTTVYQNENIQENLNNLGLKTISLGMGGNGPLLSLASLIEYKKSINPKNIIYIHTERNDVVYDLFVEKKNSLLINYLLEDFSQNLLLKKDELNLKLEKFNLEIIENINNKTYKKKFVNFLKLKEIRKIFNLENIGLKDSYKDKNIIEKEIQNYQDINQAIKNNSDLSSNIFLLKKIIKKMSIVYPEANFYVFYLPTRESLISKEKTIIQLIINDIIKENSYNYINLSNELKDFDEKFIKSLYPQNYEHFNKKGYKFISKLIYKKISLN